ncbi:unnamed protein product [Cylicocyclus nassatus]|uniref:Uncharacterized protein n=1 Tax=Cylicocyclus nassatus TaxID=53992 RepID=A0AA36DUT3_CYLNA|nr:unnamed protein product [Cylicocyclus nassatus]
MEPMRRNRHRRRSDWTATEEGSSSSHPRRPRLSPEPSTSSEPAASLPSFAEGAADEETEPSQVVDEEMAEPNHAAGSETVELGQGAVGNVVELDHQDKLLFFACHTVLHGTSTAELRRMMMLIEVATGRAANICVADVTRFMDNLKSDIRLRNHAFCSSCFRTLVNKRALCANLSCDLYGIHPKRSKSLRRPSLSLLDIRPQMESVLATHLSLLINVHRRLHESYFDSGTRSEATDFPMFKNNVESPDEFSRHIMSLQLTIATDGFVPARLSRQELWPLYVRVDDLPSKIGNNYLNIIMAGVLWTSKTPHEELWEGLWTHLATELALVNSEPLQILDNENLLLAKIKELEGQVNSLKQMCKRNGAATHETSGTIFAYENLKGHHVIKYDSPFKEAVLNDILRAYAPTNRVKHKTCLVITEFLRTVFKQVWWYKYMIVDMPLKCYNAKLLPKFRSFSFLF